MNKINIQLEEIYDSQSYLKLKMVFIIQFDGTTIAFKCLLYQYLTPRMSIKLLLSLILLTLLATCFEEQHNEQRLMAFYQNHSLKPILHTYYNRHFKNSTKFRQFERVLNDLYNSHGDYIDILLTDCDQDTELKLSTCERMSKTKDNRYVTGTVPSSQFRRIGNVLVQSPPQSQGLGEHSTDVYTQEQLYGLLRSLFPNYYQQLNNMEEYQQFLLPRYSPKLIAFVREDDEFPLVMKQIAIANYLRMDFAFITDLNEQLISHYKVKQYPSFAIIKYNFNQSKSEEHFYTASQLTEQNYGKIKKFVTQFTLQNPRNDLLFHMIKMPTKSEIITVETEGQLNQQKQMSNGWAIIGHSIDGKIPKNLQQFQNRYGRYFTYINYVHESEKNLQLYNKFDNFLVPIQQQQLKFNALSFEDFRSNLTVWLTKDLIILGVHEDYAHICGIAQTLLFRTQIRCLIISNEGKKQLQQFMKIDFDVGFIARIHKTYKNGELQNKQTKGVKLMADDYTTIYNELDFITRMKIKDQLDQYLQRPVSEVQIEQTIMDTCIHPIKKCIFLLTNLNKKDRTFQQYLKQIAFDYMNSIDIYELDIDSNPELIKAIGGIKDKKADLLAFNPKRHQYTKLNKKVTRNLISQFIKAYVKEDKRLKRQNAEIIMNIVIRKKNKKNNQSVKMTEQTEEEL